MPNETQKREHSERIDDGAYYCAHDFHWKKERKLRFHVSWNAPMTTWVTEGFCNNNKKERIKREKALFARLASRQKMAEAKSDDFLIKKKLSKWQITESNSSPHPRREFHGITPLLVQLKLNDVNTNSSCAKCRKSFGLGFIANKCVIE